MKYQGGCHCGAVKYEVETDLGNVIDCNCSHCHKKGLVLTFIEPTQFTLSSGEENLTEYRFNTERIAHVFCKTCGVQSFARGKRKDGSDMVAINVRCLEGIDLSNLKITHVNGKDY